MGGAGTKGRLERCDVARCAGAGLEILSGAAPVVALCKCVPQPPRRVPP